MLTLRGKHIFLRALEPEDLEYVLTVENDESLWHISETVTPFSVYAIKEYLSQVHKDIYEVKQLRLAICELTGDVVGFVDLFDFDPLNLRAGVGILISDREHRSKGFGSEALELLQSYCKEHLQLHQLYANIGEENKASIELFERAGYRCIGIKKDWRRFRESYTNELLYQHIL